MESLLDYDGLIYSIISKYPSRFDRDDLYQVAYIGLMDAYKHYNNSYDTKFSTFAYYYIVGEVNKYIRESNSIKVSKNLIDVKKRILKAREVMAQRLGREPNNLELSNFLEIDENIINDALIATDEVESFENVDFSEKTYDDNSPTLLDLRNEISKLSDLEKKLIKERYYNELTQMEAASLLGISQVQVSRKESKILKKLKQKLVV